jgi:hypothetical protein
MRLTLRFHDGQIEGDGNDRVGAFRIRGEYTAEGEVGFVKRYVLHPVEYEGKWDGQMIFGKWNIFRAESGEFEIWPEGEEPEEVREEERQSDARELVKT